MVQGARRVSKRGRRSSSEKLARLLGVRRATAGKEKDPPVRCDAVSAGWGFAGLALASRLHGWFFLMDKGPVGEGKSSA